MSRANRQPGIYRISCRKTRGAYIGRSTDIPQRWRSHRKELSEGAHHNDKLQASYDLYGPTALKFKIVKEAKYFLPFWEWLYWKREQANPFSVTFNEIKPSKAPRRRFMIWRKR